MPSIPAISNLPHHYPDCCLSLSTKLIQAIRHFQPPGCTLISIGSGSGLLEALIQRQNLKSRVIGLEVNAMVNSYLAPENAVIVKGTWDIYDKSSEEDTWLFVYPRSPKLISAYLELSKVPNTVIWLGPRKDWEEFHAPFLAYGEFAIEEIEDAGLVSYEAMFVMTKRNEHSSIHGSTAFSTLQFNEI